MGVPITVQLDQVRLQLTDHQIKEILRHTLENNPALLRELFEETKREYAPDVEVNAAIKHIFAEFDDVFKALA